MIMSKKKLKCLAIIFTVNVIILYSISAFAVNKISLTEKKREQHDIETLENLQRIVQKQVYDEDVNDNIEVWFHSKDIIRVNMGRNEKLNFTAIKNGFPVMIQPVLSELQEYDYVYSLSGRMAQEGIYVYINKDYTVKIQIEQKHGVPVKCNYIDDEFAR